VAHVQKNGGNRGNPKSHRPNFDAQRWAKCNSFVARFEPLKARLGKDTIKFEHKPLIQVFFMLKQ
jgi:hypothetical protein